MRTRFKQEVEVDHTFPSPSPGSPDASRKHRVWIGNVPSSLCMNEAAIRQIYEPFGTILSIKVHHDALSAGADGFMFLEFANEEDAAAAVQAVNTACDNHDIMYEGMRARVALARGPASHVPDRDIADLLLGRRQASVANPFSQLLASQQDEDDLILQSLSQRSLSQRPKRKKRKTTLQLVDDE